MSVMTPPTMGLMLGFSVLYLVHGNGLDCRSYHGSWIIGHNPPPPPPKGLAQIMDRSSRTPPPHPVPSPFLDEGGSHDIPHLH